MWKRTKGTEPAWGEPHGQGSVAAAPGRARGTVPREVLTLQQSDVSPAPPRCVSVAPCPPGKGPEALLPLDRGPAHSASEPLHGAERDTEMDKAWRGALPSRPSARLEGGGRRMDALEASHRDPRTRTSSQRPSLLLQPGGGAPLGWAPAHPCVQGQAWLCQETGGPGEFVEDMHTWAPRATRHHGR